MSTAKRERDTSEPLNADTNGKDFSPADIKTKSPSKKTKACASPQGSPRKRGGSNGPAQAWTEQEDAVMMEGIQKYISEYQPDYDAMLKAVNSLYEDRERTKVAVKLHWHNVIKPKLLRMTAAGEGEK